jgi:NAD(P)-dependent dehydrogenase (short-subunit alcohol dehydrogenase family)
MKNFQNKVAIVTGAGRGIGRALAVEFAKNGMKVVCVSRTQAQIEETVSIIENMKGKAIGIQCDVTIAEQVEMMVNKTVEVFGSIDILFNNAGSFNAIGAVWEVDPTVWWKDVKTNLFGSMLCSRAVLKVMFAKNEGIIINMNGGGAASPLMGGSGYGSSKAALLRLTDTLAAELAKINSNILVFAMGPGFVKTEMTLLQLQEQGQKWLPGCKEALDQGNYRQPEDCAIATMKLLRIANKYLCGRVFGVDTDFDEIEKRCKEIEEKDLLVIRFRS